MSRKMNSDIKETGEPDAGKPARPVRGRGFGKVPLGNSLGSYPTVNAGETRAPCLFMPDRMHRGADRH